MAHLHLDELRIGSVLDQMRNMTVAQTMWREIGIHAERVTVGREALLNLPRPQPPTPLGDPHRRVVIKSEPRPNVDQVILDGFGGPRHHGGDHASFRWGPSG